VAKISITDIKIKPLLNSKQSTKISQDISKEINVKKHNIKKQHKKAKIISDGANIANMVQFANRLDSAVKNAKKDIIEQAKKYQNNSLPSQAGFVAESTHIGSFNIDSAIKRSTLKAVKEKNGFHGDYKILKGNKVVAKGEFKHYNTAKQTENAMRGYGDRELVGPKEQIDEIKKIAKQKALKNRQTRPEVAKEHQQVHKKVTDSIKKENVSSKPKTNKEIKKITKKAAKGKIDTREILPDFKESIKSSALAGAKDGAKIGALFGGITSTVSNIKDVVDGKKDTKDAIIDTAKDAAVSALDSAVKNAAGSATKTASLYLAEKVGSQTAKSVLRSSAPVIVATTVIETSKDAIDYFKGDIDGEEFTKKAVKNCATSAGGWAGAEAGAMLGTMVGGPVGTVVGGIVGGIAGALGIGSLFG